MQMMVIFSFLPSLIVLFTQRVGGSNIPAKATQGTYFKLSNITFILSRWAAGLLTVCCWTDNVWYHVTLLFLYLLVVVVAWCFCWLLAYWLVAAWLLVTVEVQVH